MKNFQRASKHRRHQFLLLPPLCSGLCVLSNLQVRQMMESFGLKYQLQHEDLFSLVVSLVCLSPGIFHLGSFAGWLRPSGHSKNNSIILDSSKSKSSPKRRDTTLILYDCFFGFKLLSPTGSIWPYSEEAVQVPASPVLESDVRENLFQQIEERHNSPLSDTSLFLRPLLQFPSLLNRSLNVCYLGKKL